EGQDQDHQAGEGAGSSTSQPGMQEIGFLENLSRDMVSLLCKEARSKPAKPSRGGGGRGRETAAAVRLAEWGTRRAHAAYLLERRLKSIREYVELARVTGLELGDVMYRAQMARTMSLFLRVASRKSFVLGDNPPGRGLAKDTTV
ncbi:unnamed protein product, partial [Discosporangium mesarthrocarpum]